MGLLISLSLPYDTFLFRSCARPNVAESEFLAASETEEGRAADARAAAAARKIAAMCSGAQS